METNNHVGVMPEEMGGDLLTDADMEELGELAKVRDKEGETPEEQYVEGVGEVYSSNKRKEFREEKNNNAFLPIQELDNLEKEINESESVFGIKTPPTNNELSEEGLKSVKEELVKITENSPLSEEENEFDIPSPEDEEEPYTPAPVFDDDDDLELVQRKHITEIKAKNLIHSETTDLRKANKDLLKEVAFLRSEVEKANHFTEEGKKKLQEKIEGLKKYYALVQENDRTRKRIEGAKMVSLEDFTPNEIMELKNLFNEYLGSYEHSLHDVNILSDKTMEKAKAFKTARKIIMAVSNLIEEKSLTRMKMDKLLAPSEKFGTRLLLLWERYDKEVLMQGIIVTQMLEILAENDAEVTKIVMIFSAIASRKMSLNFDDVAGIKITKAEGLDLYNEINRK